MADHTFPTDQSSAGYSDIYLTDSRKAEALVTTSASSSVENSTLGEEAINATHPLKKA